jgi:hypothetical protein
MTYMRSWQSHRLTLHTWLGLNPEIGRPLSRIFGDISFFFIMLTIPKWYITSRNSKIPQFLNYLNYLRESKRILKKSEDSAPKYPSW